MNNLPTRSGALASILLFFVSLGGKAAEAGSQMGLSAEEFLDAKGNMIFPADKIDYRRNWSYLGNWLVPAGADSKGFHEVFAQKEAVDFFRKNNRFADGTVLIKEIRDFQRSNLTTGKEVYHLGANKIWFVMIKDKDGKHKGPNWGDGWGWGLFKVGSSANQSSNYRVDCLGCHVPAKNDDWVYLKGYPTLKQQPFR